LSCTGVSNNHIAANEQHANGENTLYVAVTTGSTAGHGKRLHEKVIAWKKRGKKKAEWNAGTKLR
jgi:hypothetical protein